MAISIRNAEVESLARRLAKRRGKSITGVIGDALRAELGREERIVATPGRLARMRGIAKRCAARPELCPGIADRDLYDENGLPK